MKEEPTMKENRLNESWKEHLIENQIIAIKKMLIMRVHLKTNMSLVLGVYMQTLIPSAERHGMKYGFLHYKKYISITQMRPFCMQQSYMSQNHSLSKISQQNLMIQ